MKSTRICKLSDLADVAIGYQHREKMSHVEHGSHQMIQAKDIAAGEDLAEEIAESPRWRVVTTGLDRVTPKGDASRYRIRQGDVLFLSRGTTNVAVPLVEGAITPMPTDWDELIPAYVFYIVRPQRELVLPEYLAWYINQPPSQAYLARNSRGSVAKLLPKSSFETLEVPVPSVELQNKILELESLRSQEEFLLRKLVNARKQIVLQTCLGAIAD
jgi:hypothetical protein